MMVFSCIRKIREYRKDGYNFNNASALVGYNFSENSELSIYTRFLKSESDNDQSGGEFGDDPTYLTDQEEFSIRGEGKLKLYDGFWNQKFGLSILRNVRNNSYDTSAASVNYPFMLMIIPGHIMTAENIKLIGRMIFK